MDPIILGFWEEAGSAVDLDKEDIEVAKDRCSRQAFCRFRLSRL